MKRSGENITLNGTQICSILSIMDEEFEEFGSYDEVCPPLQCSSQVCLEVRALV
jgi:hypothetical protein